MAALLRSPNHIPPCNLPKVTHTHPRALCYGSHSPISFVIFGAIPIHATFLVPKLAITTAKPIQFKIIITFVICCKSEFYWYIRDKDYCIKGSYTCFQIDLMAFSIFCWMNLLRNKSEQQVAAGGSCVDLTLSIKENYVQSCQIIIQSFSWALQNICDLIGALFYCLFFIFQISTKFDKWSVTGCVIYPC